MVKEEEHTPSIINVTLPPEKLGNGYLNKRTLLSVSSCGICGKKELKDIAISDQKLTNNLAFEANHIHNMYTVMHKPFNNINEILEDIKTYNKQLYLCCLMTYGCLLRPHREIRELTWSDFSDELKYIHLSGNKNKSGRNRIVPVPTYVRELLVKGEPHHNIFSGKPQPLNKDYFKTLWNRFKRQSKILEQGQTLYSFRHSGAIEIFKRTGSITKLQKAMGHSSINVSLTYLRGIEIAELKEEDMPMV